MAALISKPGKHGTLYLFRITYRDAGDRYAFPIPCHLWAYDIEHAEDRFNDSDDDGWVIMDIAHAREGARS